MPGFYRVPAAREPLAQGDIFDGVPIIGATLSPAFQFLETDTPGIFSAKNIALVEIAEGMLLAEEIRLTRAIVISQSCDAGRAPRVLLAPIQSHSSKAKGASLWSEVQNLATSLREPKTLYLPGNSVLKFERSTAEFGSAFSVPRAVLENLAHAGRRKASLGRIATEYLQHRLAVMLSRVAQDDYAWPSAEDLALKKEWLKESLTKQTRILDQKRHEFGATVDADAQLTGYRERIAQLQAELLRVEQLTPNADTLET